jgi:hypothetical protein
MTAPPPAAATPSTPGPVPPPVAGAPAGRLELTVGTTVGTGVAVPDTDGASVGELVPVPLVDGVAGHEGEAVAVTDGVTEGVTDGVTEGVAEAVGVTVTVTVTCTVTAGAAVLDGQPGAPTTAAPANGAASAANASEASRATAPAATPASPTRCSFSQFTGRDRRKVVGSLRRVIRTLINIYDHHNERRHFQRNRSITSFDQSRYRTPLFRHKTYMNERSANAAGTDAVLGSPPKTSASSRR